MTNASLDAIAERYAGEVRDGRVHFSHGGVRFRALVGVSSGVPDELLVTVLQGTLPRILLRIEIGSDRTAKRWRLAREVQLGDPRFDDRVYIDARAEDRVVRHVLGPAEVRAAALRLLDECPDIRMDEAGVTLRLPGPEELQLDRLARMIDAAVAFARALPGDASSLGSRTAARADTLWEVGGMASGIVGIALLIVGLIASVMWPPVDRFAMLAIGVVGSLAVWVPVALVLLLVIRGRADAHRRLPVALGVALVSILPLGPCALAAGNVLFDASPPVEYALEPLESHIGESDDDPYVWVRFRSFRDPEESLDQRFDGSRLPDAGARVHVVVHAGAFGFPWLENAHLEY